jgi:hypothetical protein
MENQQAAGARPRITLDDVNRAIKSEFYFTAAEGVLGESEMGTEPAVWTGLHRTTFCVLVLDNHARVVGVNHGSVDPANHDPELGRRYAREDAISRVWELIGFRLRDWLHTRPVGF